MTDEEEIDDPVEVQESVESEEEPEVEAPKVVARQRSRKKRRAAQQEAAPARTAPPPRDDPDRWSDSMPERFHQAKTRVPDGWVRIAQVVPARDDSIVPSAITAFNDYADLAAWVRDNHWRGETSIYRWSVFDKNRAEWTSGDLHLRADPDWQKRKKESMHYPPPPPPPPWGYGYPGVPPAPYGAPAYHPPPPPPPPSQQHAPPPPPPPPPPAPQHAPPHHYVPPPVPQGMDPTLGELFRQALKRQAELEHELATARHENHTLKYQAQHQAQRPAIGPQGQQLYYFDQGAWHPYSPHAAPAAAQPAAQPAAAQPKSVLEQLGELAGTLKQVNSFGKTIAGDLGYRPPEAADAHAPNPTSAPDDFPVPIKDLGAIRVMADANGNISAPTLMNLDKYKDIGDWLITKVGGLINQAGDKRLEVSQKEAQLIREAAEATERKLAAQTMLDRTRALAAPPPPPPPPVQAAPPPVQAAPPPPPPPPPAQKPPEQEFGMPPMSGHTFAPPSF